MSMSLPSDATVAAFSPRLQVVIVGILAVYTIVLVVLLMRNVHALRAHHACSDVSAPLCRFVAGVISSSTATESSDSSKISEKCFDVIQDAGFHSVRILVFTRDHETVFLDTASVTSKNTTADETQRAIRDAWRSAESSASSEGVVVMSHRLDGTHLTHITGMKTESGHLVLTEARAQF